MMMVVKTRMKTRIHRQCPYCLGTDLKVIDYDVTTGVEQRFGMYKFILKCSNSRCGGTCVDINNLETNREIREQNQRKELAVT